MVIADGASESPSSVPMLLTRRTEEAHDRPSLYAELTTLLTSPDVYIAALVLLVGVLAPEAVPQHQRGAPRNSSGLLSNVYLDNSQQACPMWLLLTLCFAVPCAVGLALAVLSPARGTCTAQTKDQQTPEEDYYSHVCAPP